VKRQRRRAVLWGLGLAATGIGWAAPVLRVASGEWPPYATEHRADQGLTLNLLRRALEARGHTVSVDFMPWARALAMTRAGQYDLTAAWGDLPERRADFLVSDNLIAERWVFVRRRDGGFDWAQPADLTRYRLGLVRSYTYTAELWGAVQAGQQPHQILTADINGLRMLLAGRIDAIPMADEVACTLARTLLMPDEQQRLALHPRPLGRLTMHALLPRTRSGSEALRQDINAGLAELAASGELARLSASKPDCPPGWLP
jgi:polar amino acid transport system substrate-binding protein